MDTKIAREMLTKLEALKNDELYEALSKVECSVLDAEAAQEEVDALTDEDRAGCAEDEEFTCECDLREALEAVETAFEDVMEAIEEQREALNRAEHLVNVAFGVDDGYEDHEEQAAA